MPFALPPRPSSFLARPIERAWRCALIAASALACLEAGAADLAPESEALPAAAAPLWQPDLPADTSAVTPVASVNLAGCTLTIGTATQMPPYPPRYLAWVHKAAASGRVCRSPQGYIVLGSSYATPAVSIARHPFFDLVAASFTVKSTPSGEAHTQLDIVQFSFWSGAITKHAGLAARPPTWGEPQLGNVWSGNLAIDVFGDLIVTGVKNGILSDSDGGGDNYRAVYNFFVFDPSPNPAPSSIVTY